MPKIDNIISVADFMVNVIRERPQLGCQRGSVGPNEARAVTLAPQSLLRKDPKCFDEKSSFKVQLLFFKKYMRKSKTQLETKSL